MMRSRRLHVVLLTGLVSPFAASVAAEPPWAFEERFDGLDPASPSQELLPRSFDYAVTHRTHAADPTPEFVSYPADHGEDCAGPAAPDYPQHPVVTSHLSGGSAPDESFFVCREHMMSSMGDVEGYSVTAFWPRQEFDFAGGGVLAFDVNINDGHPRSWWEILIAPREQANVGAAQDWLPIDETYPRDRIVLTFDAESRRQVQVGTGLLPPDGWTVDEKDWRSWRYVDPDDPALDDRTVRRSMRIVLARREIRWQVEKVDGTYDLFRVEVPEGLPFSRGLVLFKTHAYTPEKDDNFDLYTYHWDNIRFSGPVVGRYDAHETLEIAYLEANGDRPIGDSATQTITLPAVGPAPRLAGQLHGPLTGQVLLSINGGPERVLHPHQYASGADDPPDCGTSGWATFSTPLRSEWLRVGENTFRWTVGPRPDCALDWWWDGFSVKGLEVQLDRVD